MRKKLRRAAHEGLRPMGEQGLARDRSGDKRHGGRQQQHAPASIGQPDQQPERDEDAEKPHHFTL